MVDVPEGEAIARFNTGNPAGFMAEQIKQGVSANQGLRNFIEAGGHFERQSWLTTWRNVSEALTHEQQAATLDPYTVPSGEQYATWNMGRGGQFASQVRVFFRDRDSGVIGFKQFTYITDEEHTPANAEIEAIENYSAEGQEAFYGETILGALTTNVFMTEPFA